MLSVAVASRSRLLALAALALAAAGCHSNGLPAQSVGYLANDACAQSASASACAVRGAACRWIELAPAAGVATSNTPVTDCAQPASGAPNALVGCYGSPPASGVCAANDPCLSLGESACHSAGSCAWSAVRSLCPVGADCAGGGFCHAKDQGGTDCACVSPLACPMGATCPPVECDCSGGGAGGSGGSGGACSCACEACAPGQSCKPCACNCDDGGVGCVAPGTCITTCPSCAPGEKCACATVCDGGVASGGGPTTSPPTPTTGTGTAMSSGSASGSSSPGFPEGRSSNPDQPPCACACAPCPAGALCPPCACDCAGSGSIGTGCIAPPLPGPLPTPIPTPCPEIACAADCAKGYVKAANGCDTCSCL